MAAWSMGGDLREGCGVFLLGMEWNGGFVRSDIWYDLRGGELEERLRGQITVSSASIWILSNQIHGDHCPHVSDIMLLVFSFSKA